MITFWKYFVAEKPCESGMNDCDTNSMCVDEGHGNYRCDCYPGYTKDSNTTCVSKYLNIQIYIVYVI